jgi:hypothetical protein
MAQGLPAPFTGVVVSERLKPTGYPLILGLRHTGHLTAGEKGPGVIVYLPSGGDPQLLFLITALYYLFKRPSAGWTAITVAMDDDIQNQCFPAAGQKLVQGCSEYLNELLRCPAKPHGMRKVIEIDGEWNRHDFTVLKPLHIG